MSAPAHTPGEWRAEDRGHRVHGIRFFWLVPDKVSMGTANPADAQLAAAAPEMLKALQDILAADDDGQTWGAAAARARAAIAKARGTTPTPEVSHVG